MYERIDWLNDSSEIARQFFGSYIRHRSWDFPDRTLYFFSDLHADAKAFDRSLSFCHDTQGTYVIGGDFFDKGPSNLALLDRVYQLTQERETIILAGNHDVRMKMVMEYWDERSSKKYEKIFSPQRMEKRVDPFLEEVGTMEHAQDLFLAKDGTYSWLFENMDLMYRSGSFLMLHAGLDDKTAKLISKKGHESQNEEFRKKLMNPKDLYGLYQGRLGNCMRTKYRTDNPLKDDLEFSLKGKKRLHDAGIHSLVHGHNSMSEGHQMHLIHGFLNFVCDVSIDEGTRIKDNIPNTAGGWGVLTIHPRGVIEAVSADYPKNRNIPRVIRYIDFNSQ